MAKRPFRQGVMQIKLDALLRRVSCNRLRARPIDARRSEMIYASVTTVTMQISTISDFVYHSNDKQSSSNIHPSLLHTDFDRQDNVNLYGTYSGEQWGKFELSDIHHWRMCCFFDFKWLRSSDSFHSLAISPLLSVEFIGQKKWRRGNLTWIQFDFGEEVQIRRLLWLQWDRDLSLFAQHLRLAATLAAADLRCFRHQILRSAELVYFGWHSHHLLRIGLVE